MTSEMTPERLAENGAKSREHLGLPREVQICARVELSREGVLWLIALKCGHWFKSHTRVEPGTMAGCMGCDSLSRLSERSDRQAAEIDRLKKALEDLGSDCLNYPGTCQVATSPREHEDICPVYVAGVALNPEPTS